MTELIKFIKALFTTKTGKVKLTIVRNDRVGMFGNIYLNDTHIGVSCDSLDLGEAIYSGLTIGWSGMKRVLRNDTLMITRAEFTDKKPLNTVLVGSLELAENKLILAHLIDKLSNVKEIELEIVNRFALEFDIKSR